MTEHKDIGTDAKIVDQCTVLTGDRAKLKDLLCNRLTECGWRDEVRGLCRATLQGTEVKNVEAVLAEVTPKARAMVPDAVKQELLLKIKDILIAQQDKLNPETET